MRAFATFMIATRRQVLLTTLGTLTGACGGAGPLATKDARSSPSSESREKAARDLADLETKLGGRVGVFALNTANGREIARRPDERFAMCSTFKWALAAAILARIDRTELALEQRVSYSDSDLLEYAPITREHVGERAMTIDALARAAVVQSDNTAANLLLAKIGGPEGLTDFVRSQGDLVTRLDRTEPALNAYAPGDPRDTTTPRAMVSLMRTILCGDSLSRASNERLMGWLRACETGKDRLRAGLPRNWIVGDKTGTGEHGSVNDLAIALPPGRAAILIASYQSEGSADLAAHNDVHAAIGRMASNL